MSDTTAGKWDFTDDEERREAILEEARINQEGALAIAEMNKDAAVEAAEAAAPVWHWVAFWFCLFGYATLSSIFGRACS